MSPFFVVFHLMSVSKIISKCIPVFKIICLIFPTDVCEISSCTFALSLIKCHTTHYYLHHIIWIFHTKYSKQLINFSSCLYHCNITVLLIFKLSINQVNRNSFRPVTPLLDQSCRIYTYGF